MRKFRILRFVSCLISPNYGHFLPAYLLLRVVEKFLHEMKSGSVELRVGLLPSNFVPSKRILQTEHRLYVHNEVYERYKNANQEEYNWVKVQPGSCVYQIEPLEAVPLNAALTTEKGLDELTQSDSSLLVKLEEFGGCPQLVKDATISIVSYHELSNEDLDFTLGKYFETPRLLHVNQVYELILEMDLLGSATYAEYFMNFSKMKSISFRVQSLELKSGKFADFGLVMKAVSTLHQVVPPSGFHPKRNLLSIDYPSGLRGLVDQLSASLEPFQEDTFIEQNGTQPLFLIQGDRGSGQVMLVEVVAKHLGYSVYHTDMADVMSTSLPGQTESKLSTILSKTIRNPIILCLDNFEVFSGEQLDLRLVLSLETQIDQFFKNNKRAVIVAVANGAVNHPKLRSMFLEVITISLPSKAERQGYIEWLYKKRATPKDASSTDLSNFFKQAADKTNGFSYGDLQTLMDNFIRRKGRNQAPDVNEFEREANELLQSRKESATTIPKVSWEEIGGLVELKEEIQSSIKLPIKHKHLMGKYMKRSGILLHGLPGTGKTLIAKAVATDHQVNFLQVQGPELLNMYVGQSEENVRQVFANAKANSPCVVFLDELDSLAPNRGQTGDSGGVMDRVVSQLLSELDIILADSSCQIFILAATNRPDLIDPALLRPGRFDKLLRVDAFKTAAEKESVLRTITSKFKLLDDVVLNEVAKKIKGESTGAELYAICSQAWLNAVRRTVNKHKAKEGKAAVTAAGKEAVIVNSSDFDVALTKA